VLIVGEGKVDPGFVGRLERRRLGHDLAGRRRQHAQHRSLTLGILLDAQRLDLQRTEQAVGAVAGEADLAALPVEGPQHEVPERLDAVVVGERVELAADDVGRTAGADEGGPGQVHRLDLARLVDEHHTGRHRLDDEAQARLAALQPLVLARHGGDHAVAFDGHAEPGREALSQARPARDALVGGGDDRRGRRGALPDQDHDRQRNLA
jgi:hypothetical protein